MGNIFISYRRDDSLHAAGRVHDRLANEFGRDVVFMDVDAIPLGVNFVKVLQAEVAKCAVVIAIVGPSWASVKSENGQLRLFDSDDFVRIELAAALARDIPVIPVLLDGAKIPNARDLPPDLAELSLRNGIQIRGVSFHSDMGKLIAGLASLLANAGAHAPLATSAESPKPTEAPKKTMGSGKAPSQRALQVMNGQGKWLTKFDVDERGAEPTVFRDLFIVIEGSRNLAPGTIVTGKLWQQDGIPLWQVVHGHLSDIPTKSWYRVSSKMTHLGATWRPEFAALSEEIFQISGGKRLTAFISHE